MFDYTIEVDEGLLARRRKFSGISPKVAETSLTDRGIDPASRSAPRGEALSAADRNRLASTSRPFDRAIDPRIPEPQMCGNAGLQHLSWQSRRHNVAYRLRLRVYRQFLPRRQSEPPTTHPRSDSG